MAPLNADAASYGDLSDRLDNLIQQILTIGDGLKVSEEDARKRMLQQVSSAAALGMSAMGMLDVLSSAPPETVSRVLRVAKPEFAEYAHKDMLRGAKLFLLAESTYQFTHGMLSLLQVLDPTDGHVAPGDIFREVLIRSGVPNPEPRLSPLLASMLLRDSLRAGGLHYSPRSASHTSYHVTGIDYTFQHGRRVECDTWDHVLHVTRALLQVVDEVLSSPVVTAVPFVPDALWTVPWSHDIAR